MLHLDEIHEIHEFNPEFLRQTLSAISEAVLSLASQKIFLFPVLSTTGKIHFGAF
jgi:hypothetical protein